MHRDVVEQYAGDEKRFVGALERQGVSVADYREFTAEEITISAMLYEDPRRHARSRQAEWLANLRRGAKVVRLAADNTRR